MSELTSKSLSICPHRFDGRRELCSLCAELPPSKKLDLLPCPFCGSSRIEIHEEFGGSSCSKCGALGPTRGPKDMLQRWNQRYSADEPPAGQYCEHGVRSDLRCFSCNPASSQPPSERQEHLTRTLAWVSTHEGVSKHVREIVSLALYGDVPTPPPPVEQREIGWLVEAARTNGPQRYRTMEQGMSAWTTDPNKAIRFARRADAEMFADEDDEAWHICEHMWVDPAPEETHTAACARFPSLADPELKWRDRPCTCRQRQRHALTKGGEQA
jgi:hypothetical protein